MTVYLSAEGMAELQAEMDAPPKDTPERRATFERMRSVRPLVEDVARSVVGPMRRSAQKPRVVGRLLSAEEVKAISEPPPEPNGISCPNCGAPLLDTHPGWVYLSDPPMVGVRCSSCAHQGYRVPSTGRLILSPDGE